MTLFGKKEKAKPLRMFFDRKLIQIPVLGSKWLFSSFSFLVFWQFLDGFTTKIGLDLGLAEVGTYSTGVLGNYGFWGLMAWKFGVVAAVLSAVYACYFFAKRYDPKYLNLITIILTVGCFLASLGSIMVVSSNISQIELALQQRN